MGAVASRRLREELEGKLRPVADKLVPVEAAMRLVGDGDHLAIGGTLYSRTPMALLFELLRQGRSGLELSRPLTCYEAELFLVAGAARGIVTSWVGIGLPWGISRVVRELVEGRRATYEEWSHLALGLRYKAGAMGVPFLPTYSMLGSDLVRLVDTHELTCPFTGEKVLLVPALNPDVALVHVQRADRFGNAQIDGYTHMDAFPHECYGRYEADFAHFDEYTAAIRRDGMRAVSAYLERHVHGQADFAGFLAGFGEARLEAQRERAAELMAP